MKRLRTLLVGLVTLAFAGLSFAQTAVVQSVQNVSNKAQTYSATYGVTLASTPTDAFVLRGSSTKTVYVESLTVSCTKTSGGYGDVTLYKRSTANSGGTAVTVANLVPHDSSNASATAIVYAYTANPTTGTGLSFAQQMMSFPAPATLADGIVPVFSWGNKMGQYIVLRGAAQSLAVNFGGATLTGGVCSFSVTWIEV